MKSLAALRDRLSAPRVRRLNEVIAEQNRRHDEMTSREATVREVLLRTLGIAPDVVGDGPVDVARLAESVETHVLFKTTRAIDAEAKAANVEAELYGARRDYRIARERYDALEQANAKLTAELADARHVIDQCEADRNALAAERDEAKREARDFAKANVLLLKANNNRCEQIEALERRIAALKDESTHAGTAGI
jgi:chromosome segregation ATPase